jgi:hypothetical protein
MDYIKNPNQTSYITASWIRGYAMGEGVISVEKVRIHPRNSSLAPRRANSSAMELVRDYTLHLVDITLAAGYSLSRLTSSFDHITGLSKQHSLVHVTKL